MKRRCPRGGGAGYFLKALSVETEECIIWPYGGINTGYGQVSWEGKQELCHRLACRLFHGDPPGDKREAAHSCGVRRCFNPRHLRWATTKENCFDKQAHGTQLKGERIHQSVLTADQVRTIRSRCAKGETQSLLALEYGVRQQTISKIATRRHWRHI